MLVAADTDVVTGKLICYGFVELHHLTNNQENYVFQMLLTKKKLIKTLCYAQTFIKHKYIHKLSPTQHQALPLVLFHCIICLVFICIL